MEAILSVNTKNNIPKASKSQVDTAEYIQSKKEEIIQEIQNAKPPEYLRDMPIVLAELKGSAVINMIIADAGAGKSLFTRAAVAEVLKDDDFIVLEYNLEYMEIVEKERNFPELLENGRFNLIRGKDVESVREALHCKTTAEAIIRNIKDFRRNYPNKRIYVVVDSFEDFIEDTNDDKELKRIFKEISLMEGVTFHFNHHISKDISKPNALRSRGSMVIKKQVVSMLYLKQKVAENDFTTLFEFEITKIRTLYKPTQKVSIRMDNGTYTIKDVITTGDTEEIKVLKSAYFALKKESPITKTKLIETISKSLRKRKEKVRAILDKHTDMFAVEKGDRRLEYYSLTTNEDTLERYQAMLGLGDVGLSDVKAELLRELDGRDPDEDVNIEISLNGKAVSYQKLKTIRYNLYRMSDEEAEAILSKLKPKVADEHPKLTNEAVELAEQLADDDPVFETLEHYGILTKTDFKEKAKELPEDVLKSFLEKLMDVVTAPEIEL